MSDRARSCRLLGAHPLPLTLAVILPVAVQTGEVCGGPPEGACCFEDIACIFVPEEDCISFGGTWQGAGTACEPGICGDLPTGACCLVDVCVVTTEAACNLGFGFFQGVGTDCSGEICEVEGACCIGFADPVCEILSEAECAVALGRYLGDDTNCAEPVCDDSSPTGACCLIAPVGTCVEGLTLEGCLLIFNFEAVWQGPGTTCAEVDCPAWGACCLPGGLCADLNEDLCAAGGGVFKQGNQCYSSLCDNPASTPAPCCGFNDLTTLLGSWGPCA